MTDMTDMNDMINTDFSGKHAIITGAAAGIGRATAVQIAQRGGDVAVVDIDTAPLESLRTELEARGRRVLAFGCDIRDEEGVRDVVRETLDRFGSVEILVNNAALWRRSLPFMQTDAAMWKRYIDVNILGTMYFTRAVLDSMLERAYGRIINIASVAGVYGIGSYVDYSMTKGAVIAFTRALAKEMTPRGVLVNCVSPGSVSDDREETGPTELSYMGRTAAHTEIANLICFIAGDGAGYIAWQNYIIDGCRKKI